MLEIQIESWTSGEAAVTHSEYVAGTARANRLLLAADLAGTLVFAVGGAMAAVDGNLDLVGIMTLAFCTALGGGIIRDTLLGAVPPAALRDWRYPAIALTAAVLVFALHGYVRAISCPCASGLGRRGAGNLRDCRNGESYDSQNESAGRGSAGHDHRRWRRDSGDASLPKFPMCCASKSMRRPRL